MSGPKARPIGLYVGEPDDPVELRARAEAAEAEVVQWREAWRSQYTAAVDARAAAEAKLAAAREAWGRSSDDGGYISLSYADADDLDRALSPDEEVTR